MVVRQYTPVHPILPDEENGALRRARQQRGCMSALQANFTCSSRPTSAPTASHQAAL
jgi:hypothetical protein